MFKIKDQEFRGLYTEYEQCIDDDGDYVIRANGVSVLYIDKDTGKLVRFYVSTEEQKRIPELQFVNDYIAIS